VLTEEPSKFSTRTGEPHLDVSLDVSACALWGRARAARSAAAARIEPRVDMRTIEAKMSLW
jgi:hypothetical protein